MADAAWILVHAYDDQAQQVMEVLLLENNVERVHVFIPNPSGDWRPGVGIQTEIHLVNGTILYLTDAFQTLSDILKAKVV